MELTVLEEVRMDASTSNATVLGTVVLMTRTFVPAVAVAATAGVVSSYRFLASSNNKDVAVPLAKCVFKASCDTGKGKPSLSADEQRSLGVAWH